MANTREISASLSTQPGRLIRSYETSAANTELTVSTPTARGRVQRLLSVLAKYSANVTVNVTVTLNAAHGAAYDTLLQTIALSAAQNGVWLPDAEILLEPDDAIDVVAPAGGAGVTAAVTILTRET